MLVDDDDVTLYIGNLAITRNHFASEVIQFESAESAIEQLRSLEISERPGMIFLDINMPHMNGWEFLDIFEKEFYHPGSGPDVVMLTSSIDPLDREKSKIYQSVMEFISKPLTTEKLENIKKHQRVSHYW